MSRRGRIELAGGVYHVTNRGVDQRDIVRDDDDRREWFRRFNRVALRYGWRVFAHVLMTNHFHLFLKTPEANLSLGMHDLEGGYASYFNERNDRSGALFQGRYHPVFVETEGHVWSVSRYTHLNPCRAHMVPRPEMYRWSTYRFFVDPRGAPRWLDWRTVLCEFGGNETDARDAFCQFVMDGLTGNPANPLSTAFEGMLLGSDQFVSDHRHLLEAAEADIRRKMQSTTIARVLAVVMQSFDVSEITLRLPGRHGNWARDAAIWLCRQEVRVPLRQIGDAFGGISTSTVTDTVQRCEERQTRVPEYRAQCESLRERV